MRKLISILLAVVLVASMAVMTVSAAETDAAGVAVDKAVITLCGMQGESVTETYAVGDSFTAYTYLNVSELGGAIANIRAEQYYDSSVLQLNLAYEDNKENLLYGLVKSSAMDALLPVLDEGSAVANAGTEGKIFYNSTIGRSSGFKFNSDDRALVVVNYTVKAAGTAEISNSIVSMSKPDISLEKIVKGGVIVDNRFTMPVALTAPTMPVPVGATLSGTVTSYATTDTEGADIVTVELQKDSETIASVSEANLKSYSFEDLDDGDYKLVISKMNHVTRTYEVTVSGNTTENVQICPKGDANNDGRINARDIALVNGHLKGKPLTGYRFDCADVRADKRITTRDVSNINSHLKNNNSLWT